VKKKTRVFYSRYRWINLALLLVLPFLWSYGTVMLLVDWDFSSSAAAWWTVARISFPIVVALLFADRLSAFSARLVIAEPFLLFTAVQKAQLVAWTQLSRVEYRNRNGALVPSKLVYTDDLGKEQMLSLGAFYQPSTAKDLADQVKEYSSITPV
jgi:hypothetical protein